MKSHLQKDTESREIPLVIASEHSERGNQQTTNPNQARIPTRLIASALPRNDR
ncbi:MAG: hypothetical protein K2N54_00865 [Helicobacter sp.]|nr:hypothetical protein [Helicobacter sp.]